MANHFLRPRRAAVPGLYHYHSGDIFTPGAMNQSFEPRFALPVVMAIGTCIPAGRSPNPVQPPQVYVNSVSKIAGLGGLVAGQLVTQPLSDDESGG